MAIISPVVDTVAVGVGGVVVGVVAKTAYDKWTTPVVISKRKKRRTARKSNASGNRKASSK